MFCWFVCNRGDTLKCQDRLRTIKLGQSPIPGHCCNSRIFRGASPRCFPYTTACLLTQPVVGYTARDTALEFGPSSSTWKLIPLLLDVDISRCTRSPRKQMGFSHTSLMARHILQYRCDQWVSADAESVTKDLPRASQPQAILKFCPPSGLD